MNVYLRFHMEHFPKCICCFKVVPECNISQNKPCFFLNSYVYKCSLMKIKLENNNSSMLKKYEIYQNETCRVCIKYVFILVGNSNTPYIVQTVLSMTFL